VTVRAGDLVGTWALVEWVVRRGERAVHPFGPDATGHLLYGADGHMSAALAAPGRVPFASGDPLGGTDAERAAAAATYLAYGGTWSVEGGRVVHRVRTSLYPNWVGTEQVRRARLEGEELVLSTPVGRAGEAVLRWRRAGADGPSG